MRGTTETMHTLTEQLLADFRSEGEAFGLRMLIQHAAGLSVRQEGPETTYVINPGERITHNALARSYFFRWPGGSAAVREPARPLMPWPDAETVKAYALHRLGQETHPDEWEDLDPSLIDFNAELGPVPAVDAAVDQAMAAHGKHAEGLLSQLEDEAWFAASVAVDALSQEDKTRTQSLLAEFINRLPE